MYQLEINADHEFYLPSALSLPTFVGISNKDQPRLTRYAIVYCKRGSVIDLSSDSEEDTVL